MTRPITAAFACVLVVASVSAQESKGFEDILENYVRDGQVYYRALKSDRGKLDGYLTLIAALSIDKLPREEQLAFWLNAYNALVLRTVVDHYPIAGHAPQYPAKSVRQIPGAFEKIPHHVAGRSMTLDQIEKDVLPTFHDPRVYFALGRGAIGSGRLRSEAFVPARIEEQLADVAAECVTRAQCVQLDREANKITASSIFSWP